MKHFFLLGFCILTLTNCSEKSWYESMQRKAREDCINQPGSDYQACKEAYDQSYDSYKRETTPKKP